MGPVRSVGLIAALLAAAPAFSQILPADTEHHHVQAGHATELRRWNLPSETRGYVGYPVGGGSPRLLRGDPPTAEEGTWGWDYRGFAFPRKVILNWWHGKRYQGGTGAYKTDGPKLHVREEEH